MGGCGCGQQNCDGTSCDLRSRLIIGAAAADKGIAAVQGYGLQNCKQFSDRLSPCMVDRIVKSRGTPTVVSALTPVPAAEAAALQLDAPPAGFTWYAQVFPSIGVAHRFCMRETTIVNAAGQAVLPSVVALTVSALFCNPNGEYFDAWDFAPTEIPLYIATTVGRCACDKLCVDVGVDEIVRVLFLLPTAAVGTVYIANSNGKRDCWKIPPAGKSEGVTCPPSASCGRWPLNRSLVGEAAFGQTTNPPPVQPPPEPLVIPADEVPPP